MFDPRVTGGQPVEILAKISGDGENGVYLARRLEADGTKKLISIKRAKAFEQAAESVRPFATQLNHLNIAPIYNHIQIEDAEYWVGKWIHGVSVGQILEKTIADGRVIPLSLTLNIIAQLAEALSYLQTFIEPKYQARAKIAHGDVNPHNVLVQSDAGVKLIDFGLARIKLDSSTMSITAAGAHPAYASPRRLIDKRIDPQDDLFSLGIIFWELLVGRHYWDDLNAMQIQTELREFKAKDPLAYRANLPPEICRIVLNCLELEAFQGYNHPRELLADLRPVMKLHSFAADDEWLRREFGESLDKYVGALGWPAKNAGEPLRADSSPKALGRAKKSVFLRAKFGKPLLFSLLRVGAALGFLGALFYLCLLYPVFFPINAFFQSPAKDVWAYVLQGPAAADARQDHIVRINVEDGPATIVVNGTILKQKAPLYISLDRDRFALLEVRPAAGIPYDVILPPGTTAITVNYKYRRHLLRR